MKITILCSSQEHPIFPQLMKWKEEKSKEHEINLVEKVADVKTGDILFLISCSEIVKKEVRDRFKSTLVVHASDVPHGRGWSPHIWQVLEGAKKIPVTMLEAEDKVDSGKIWAQHFFNLEGHELYDEINQKLFDCTFKLMDNAIENFSKIIPQPQREEDGSYYRKRNPQDSKLDPEKSISDQFNLLRVADSNRFPCFFDYQGRRYKITISKIENIS